MHKKSLKFANVVELVKLNFTYITVLKQSEPGFNDRLEHPPVQILVVLVLFYRVILEVL